MSRSPQDPELAGSDVDHTRPLPTGSPEDVVTPLRRLAARAEADPADPSATAARDGLGAEVAELLEAQSRLRELLAVSQSLVTIRSASEVAQHLVEAACSTAGAGYSRLDLHPTGGAAPQTLEHAADAPRLEFYRTYVEQRAQHAADPHHRRDPDRMSEFSVALGSGQRSLGTLQVLDRRRGGEFTSLSRELVSTLAATGTLVLDSSAHYEQVRRRADWLEAMRRVEALVISSDDDELGVWREIADCLQRLTSSDTVALQVPGEHDSMHVLVAAGTRAQSMAGMSYPRAESVGWQAMQRGRGLVLASGAELPLRRHTLVDPRLIGPVMSVPLVGDSGPRGAVTLFRERGQPHFSDGDLELVEDFARQATVALELVEARSARTRLEHTEAREAVARNLHDHVIQRLFAVGLSLQGVAQAEPSAMQRQLQRTVQDLDATIAQIRETIFTMRSGG